MPRPAKLLLAVALALRPAAGGEPPPDDRGRLAAGDHPPASPAGTRPSHDTRRLAPPAGIRVASSLDKLRPGDPLPEGKVIALAAARGECESAQVAIRRERPVAALTASAPPLTGPSRVVPVLYRVENVELRSPSGPEGSPGPWPDPLIPERDPFHGEARRAFPVAVPAGRLQA